MKCKGQEKWEITQEVDVHRKMKRLSIRRALPLSILFLLCATAFFSAESVTANAQATLESLSLTVYLDGFVLVNHQITLSQTAPSINVSLIGETYENLLVVDGQSLPLEHSISNSIAIIYSLDAEEIIITYFTQDLTYKFGKYWTMTAETTANTTLKLPEAVSVIGVNNVPELIETTDDEIVLVMPAGLIEITYIAEHELGLDTPKSSDIMLIIAIITTLIAALIVIFVILLSRRKKPSLLPVEPKKEVDSRKLLAKHKDLRREELQVISYLVEKHGTALEADLYERLDLPRTTTWRLLKRMQGMGIVDITKSRRQNTVSIKRKYLKK